MYRTLNYNALTLPVLKSDVRGFKAQARASGVPWAQSQSVRWVGIGCLLFIGGGTVLFGALAVMAGSVALLAQDSPSRFFGIIGLVLSPLAVAGLTWLTVRGIRSLGEREWEQWFRQSRFAADNALVFSASSPDPQYPGLIFNQGSARQTVDHVRSLPGARYLDIGNYQYTTSDGKNTTTHRRGFMALNLDRRLPHMVLDAKSNGSFGLGAFGKEQSLSLEGDFDKYFTLFCPRQYETDALYVFTPDLMALLIDEASPFDVEIIDNWMFVYSNGAFPMTHPGLYERLFRIVDTVGSKTLSQTKRYVDDTIGSFEPNVVAPAGQRLQRRFPRALIVILIVFAAVVILPILVAAIAFFAFATGGGS